MRKKASILLPFLFIYLMFSSCTEKMPEPNEETFEPETLKINACGGMTQIDPPSLQIDVDSGD